jgi:hypothetical protein
VSTSTEHAVTIETRPEGRRMLRMTLTCTCGNLFSTFRGPAGFPGTQATADVISKAHLTKGSTT